MTPERKRELDVLVEQWEKKQNDDDIAIPFAEDRVPNHEAFLERAARELDISLDELLEWKRLEETEATAKFEEHEEDELAETPYSEEELRDLDQEHRHLS